MPMSCLGPVTGVPWRRISPDEAGSNPAMILSRVDFPHPLGPMTLVKLPWLSDRVTPSRALTCRLWKVLATLVILTTSWAVGRDCCPAPPTPLCVVTCVALDYSPSPAA